jgi:hypothetical protein
VLGKLDFSDALALVKRGGRVAREGWNGKGMWLFFTDNWSSSVSGNAPENFHQKPWIGMKTADDGFVPWVASQSDLLADDWEEVSA